MLTSLRAHPRPVLLVAALLVVSIVAVATVALTRDSSGGEVTVLATPPPGSIVDVPEFTHAYIIVLENKSFDQMVGSPEAPYFNELITAYGLAEAFQGVAHPSQGNYIAMVSGSIHGVLDAKAHDIDAPSIFDQLEASGRSWRLFAENVPDGCFTGAVAKDGRDGTGVYLRKHNPAISFTAISGSPERCAYIQDFTAFDPAAADLVYIVPNLCHDMHDCPIADGDAWLRDFVPGILGSEAFRSGGALFVTFDEGTDAGNRLATIVAGPNVEAGFRSDVPHNHYSLLRTLQESWGLECLAESCTANTMGEFFR